MKPYTEDEIKKLVDRYRSLIKDGVLAIDAIKRVGVAKSTMRKWLLCYNNGSETV